jgi:hypothetical protein
MYKSIFSCSPIWCWYRDWAIFSQRTPPTVYYFLFALFLIYIFHHLQTDFMFLSSIIRILIRQIPMSVRKAPGPIPLSKKRKTNRKMGIEARAALAAKNSAAKAAKLSGIPPLSVSESAGRSSTEGTGHSAESHPEHAADADADGSADDASSTTGSPPREAVGLLEQLRRKRLDNAAKIQAWQEKEGARTGRNKRQRKSRVTAATRRQLAACNDSMASLLQYLHFDAEGHADMHS